MATIACPRQDGASCFLPMAARLPLPLLAVALLLAGQTPAALAGPGAAAPATAAETAVRVRFRCLGRFDAVDVTALFFNRAPQELVLLEGEQALRLPQRLAASGARYSDGADTFWIKGNKANWSRGQAPVMVCSALT